jgi:hypothetical protein
MLDAEQFIDTHLTDGRAVYAPLAKRLPELTTAIMHASILPSVQKKARTARGHSGKLGASVSLIEGAEQMDQLATVLPSSIWVCKLLPSPS